MGKNNVKKLNIEKILLLTILLFSILLSSGCKNSGEETRSENGIVKSYGVYYLTQDESQVLFESRASLTKDSGISDYILALQEEPKDIRLKKTVGSEVMLIDYRKDDKGAILNFDERYSEMTAAKEVLFRAAVAQTILQDADVNHILFEVNGEPLKYKNGEEVGNMTTSTFIDNAGDEISSYLKKTVRFYFASADGNSLIPSDRDCIFGSNESLEKSVMEQLIAGPAQNEGYATISPDTKINTIAVKNGICYVSLDTAMVDKSVDVSEETLLYSIVNTLTSLPGINKVQISVNGETDRVLRSTLRLDEIYVFNEEIVGSD